MRLTGKVVIVTGASAGIGRGIAQVFGKEGAKVVVADIDITGGEETVASIKANGGQAVFIRTDVSIASDVKNLAEETQRKFGKIDVIVNNAAVLMKETNILDTDEPFWDKIFDVNVKGIFLTTKYVAPLMKSAGSGVIINIGSLAGIRPRKNTAVYACSKGAVITLTKALALDLAPDIRVNCVNPMVVETVARNEMPEEMKKKMLSIVPLGRLTKREDIANAAVFLASDEASMVTGVALNVDGGGGI